MPSSLESEDEEPAKPSFASAVRETVTRERRNSFSAPTSPTRSRANKAQELLGLSHAGLRLECARLTKDISDRLQIESGEGKKKEKFFFLYLNKKPHNIFVFFFIY
jgi:hypothetical protein